MKELRNLVHQAKHREKYPIAKIISEIEKEDNLTFRKELFSALSEEGLSESKALTIGFTGTPGAGKSSLLGEFCKEFLRMAPEKSMAIVAIDPSSNVSGGSLLGDRTRVVLPARENRIFFRSQPSQLELGGLNPFTYPVIRFLRHIFDYVFIETVGIGQNEIGVSLVSDLSLLVMQPLGGDQVQFMKSGIMEIPEAFVINKCDEEQLANSSYHMLLTTLEFIKDILPEQTIPPIFRTSVSKRIGIEPLFEFILHYPYKKNRTQERLWQLEKWIQAEYGRVGIRKFRSLPGFVKDKGYETMEELFQKEMRN